MPPGSRPSDQCSEPGSRGGVGTASACSLSLHGRGREGPGRRDTARRVWRQPPRPPAGTPADSRERWPLRHCRRGPWSRWQRRLQPRPAFRAGGAAAAAASGGGAPTPFRRALSHLGRPEPGLRGGPWVPGQDSAGNRRGRPGEVAREGTEGQLWSCPPHRPVLLPTRAPTPGSSWEGRRKSPPWVMICSAQPSAHHPLSPPDLCWPWGQNTTPQAWALEGAQPSELLWSRRVHR